MWRANLTDIPRTACRSIFSFFVVEMLNDDSNSVDDPTAVE
jgi:hypothetical protein